MPEQIISASGTQYGMVVNDDGTINVANSGLYLGSESYANEFGDRYIQRIAYEGTNAVYLGFADPGTATSDAGWFIKKLGYTGGMTSSILFASGNTNFDKVWDDRSGIYEVYS